MIDMSQELRVGVDLGGTKMLAALVSLDGRILAKEERPTLAQEGEAAVINRLADMIDHLVSESTFSNKREHPGQLKGIGVATAGTLDAEKGIVTLAANLGWKDVQLGSLLEARFGCTVKLANDANAAAIGEWLAGAGKGTNDCLFVTISTGIGGGFISAGKPINGFNHNAGELGHITIDYNGPRCGCGNYGCLELYASGTAIGRRGADLVRQASSGASALIGLVQGNADEVTARHVAEAAAAGDSEANAVLTEAGRALGFGMVSILHLINPEVVVLGGGASLIGAPLLDPMMQVIEERAIASIRRPVRFVPSALGSAAGAVGAAMMLVKGKVVTE
jgi:glucokinase